MIVCSICILQEGREETIAYGRTFHSSIIKSLKLNVVGIVLGIFKVNAGVKSTLKK